MRRLKAAHIGDIPLFPEVEPMLRALHNSGMRLALVSSDNEANARRQLGTAAELFTVFACGASIFGKAAKFRDVLGRAGISHPEAIAIGDEVRESRRPAPPASRARRSPGATRRLKRSARWTQSRV